MIINLRDAKRYINALRFTLPPISKEVNLYNFFIMEFIRVFYPKVYDDIWQHPWFYIPLGFISRTYAQSPFWIKDDDKKYPAIKEHVENLLALEKDAEVITPLLQSMFPMVKNALSAKAFGSSVIYSDRTEQLVSHPDSFLKYFTLRVSEADISDEFITTNIEVWKLLSPPESMDSIKQTMFEMQKQNKLKEFLSLLSAYKGEMSEQVAIEVITVIYENSKDFSLAGSENFWNSEWDKASMTLMSLINEKVSRPRIPELLSKTVQQTPDLPLAGRVVYFSANPRDEGAYDNIYSAIDIERLREELSERLNSIFIVGKRNIFVECAEHEGWKYVLNHWATNFQTFSGDNFRIVNDYLETLYRDDIKNLISVIKHIQSYRGSKEYKQMYDVKQIISVANEYMSQDTLNDENRTILTRFLQSIEPDTPTQ